jgi:hypothetical protein
MSRKQTRNDCCRSTADLLFSRRYPKHEYRNTKTRNFTGCFARMQNLNSWAGQLSRYSDWLRAGRSGDRIPVGARFSAPVQTGAAVHPASCTMGTGSFLEVESGRGVTLTPHPFLVQRSKDRVQLYLYCP